MNQMQQFIRDMAPFFTWPDVFCWLLLLGFGVWKMFDLIGAAGRWAERQVKK
jgi:hypothetical protein